MGLGSCDQGLCRYEGNRLPGHARVSHSDETDDPYEYRESQGSGFRVDTIGRSWKDSPLQISKRGEWVARVAKPDTGWSAYFVELTYPTGGKYPLKVTTAVRVVPDALPYPPFQPKR